MLHVKRLYGYVLQSFLPLLLATFGVCLFIVLMQFLWKYVDDMVGKGLELTLLAKMFFYAGLYLVPMALPLAILLASLMTFGNLGEQFELLAMKSAGISLLRIMRPIIILLIFISAGAFYFQNKILPLSQVKFFTLLISVKQKSPELDIPEGSFFKGIQGYNLYVKHKDKKGGMMRDMMIYDYSQGFENARVIVADSGRLKASMDKQYLIMTIYSGELFENLNSQKTRSANTRILYRRETFSLKEILITYDANFNMADESMLRNDDIGKNMTELRTSLDSMKIAIDSASVSNINSFRNYAYRELINPKPIENNVQAMAQNDTVKITGFDDYFAERKLQEQRDIIEMAKSKAEAIRNDYYFNSMSQVDLAKKIRGHKAELHRKFTLSFACLIFFFIGAPLGAIIRKGGLGMPAVISVILFLFYYTVDIFGIKMAKQGVWPVWQGMWVSSFVLLLLGSFFTYKAVNDSAMFDTESWAIYLRRLLGKKESRNYRRKDVIITNPDYEQDLEAIHSLDEKCTDYLEKNKKIPGYFAFWKRKLGNKELRNIVNLQESLIEDLLNSDQNLIIGKLMDYPVIRVSGIDFLNKAPIRAVCAIVFPIGLIFYIIGLFKRKEIIQHIETVKKVDANLSEEINKMLLKDGSI